MEIGTKIYYSNIHCGCYGNVTRVFTRFGNESCTITLDDGRIINMLPIGNIKKTCDEIENGSIFLADVWKKYWLEKGIIK